MARPRTERTDLGNIDRFNIVERQRERLGDLKKFRDLIIQPQLQAAVRGDDHLFSTLLRLAFESYGVQQIRLRDALSLSDGVLGRWAKMTNLPHSAMRPVVIQSLVVEVNASILAQEDVELPMGMVH